MKREIRRSASLLPLLILLVPLFLTNCSSGYTIGQKAPEIIGTDVDGNEMKLSDYLGKVIVLDFWGDW